MMRHLVLLALTGTALMTTAGCADKSVYNLQTPASSLTEQYVGASDLGKLSNKRVAITSFGVEFQTKVFYEQKQQRNGDKPAAITTVDSVDEAGLQKTTDDLYARLVADLKAAGYEVIAPEALKANPKYQQLVSDAPVVTAPQPIKFKRNDSPGGLVDGIVTGFGAWSEATIFSPTATGFYLPGNRGSRLGSAGIINGVAGSVAQMGKAVASGGLSQQHVQEALLAKDLNASLLKVYYVVSPVRSWEEGGAFPGKDWAKGKTLKYAMGTLSFGDRPMIGSYLARGNTIIGEGETHWAFQTLGGAGVSIGVNIGGGMLGKKGHPPKDGDVLVQLTKDVQIDPADESTEGIQKHLDAVQQMFLAKLKAGK